MKLPKGMISVLGKKKAAEFEELLSRYETAKKHHDDMIEKGYVSYYLTPQEVEFIERLRRNI